MAGKHRGEPVGETAGTMLALCDGLVDAAYAAALRECRLGGIGAGHHYADAVDALRKARDAFAAAVHDEDGGSDHVGQQ